MQANHELMTTQKPPSAWRDSVPATLQRWRVTLSFIFTVITLLLAQPTMRLILIGGVISLLGVGLRAWAIGHLRKDQVLSTGGPYAYTRNPLYLGSFLLGLGVITASGSLVLLITFLVLFVLLYSSAMTREAPHLRRLFPDEYPAYERAVPVFLPRLTPYPRESRSRFDPGLYKTHREYRVILILLLVLGILLTKATLGHAQQLTTTAQEDPPTVVYKVPNPFPLTEGERLEYEVHFSKLVISGKIGKLTFTFGRSDEPPLVGQYLMKATAVSGGIWPQILGIKIEDTFESFVDPTDFGVLRTRKTFSHGRKRWFELSVFDRNTNSVTLIKRDLIGPEAQPEVSQEETRSWVQDIISAVYYLRIQPLTVDQTIEFPLADWEKTLTAQVKVIGREQIKIGLGQFDTVKVQPLIFGEGNLLQRDGELFIWLTDDAQRRPIRAVVQGSFGTATIELKSIKGLGE